MKRIFIVLIAAVVTSLATAQKRVVATLEQSGADEIVHYWDNSTAPHSNGITEDETINARLDMRQTTYTDFYIYKADPEVATGQGVVVIPGGGFYKLSMPYDGFAVAKYLRSIGVSVVLVKYRLPNGVREVPIEDAVAGLNYMRAEGVKWGVDPEQVGILGSSAGGYLAAQVSTVTPDEQKPAFAILVYPVISGTTHSTHHGTFNHLLGKRRTEAEQEYFSLENRVTATTPPTLLLLADDDLTVPTISSIRYYKALKHYGIPAAMHIFPSGGHGWAGHDEYRYADPAKEAIADWLEIERKRK